MYKWITIFLVFLMVFLTSLFSVSAAIVPNDPYFKNQWYLQKIQADRAWERINSSPNITIAVIDSGVQIDHPDLKDNIWINQGEVKDGVDSDSNGFIDDFNGWDFVNNTPDPSPKFEDNWTESGVSHGTMVAGIIAAVANNNMGVSGITWQAQIMPLRVLNDQGEGRISDVVRAIDYAINNGADIINLSFVGFNYSESLLAAINRASQAGVIVVAAAGNEQENGQGFNTDETPIYPACYGADNKLVIGVAASDALDQKTDFSSYGFTCIDITAPGISFFSTITQGSNLLDKNLLYDGYWSGTSMSAPVISASLALIAEINPNLSPAEIVDVLFKTTDNISRLNPNYLGQLGAGRVNVYRAVETARELLYSRLGRLLLSPSKTREKPLLLTDKSGNILHEWDLDSMIKNGASAAAGDISGNGESEIIVAPSLGSQPEIKIYNREGKLVGRFFAYHPNFLGGFSVAVADINGDGKAEIITGAGPGGGPHVRIFDQKGQLKGQFFAADLNFRGGVNVAAGNIDGKSEAKIVVGLGQGSEPLVKIFDYRANLLGVFLAYEKTFEGGIKVAVANIDGRLDRKDEIIIVPGPGREPELKIFSDRSELKNSFLVFNKNWQNGISLAAGDLNNNGLADIVVGALAGGDPQVRIWDGQGRLMESFYTWQDGFLGGVNVSVIQLIN
jgi:subtilisin family serine protease